MALTDPTRKLKVNHDITEPMLRSMPKAVCEYIRRLEIRLDEQDQLIRRLRTIADDDREEGIIIDPYSTYPIYFAPGNMVRVWVDPGRLAIDIDTREKMTSPKAKGINVSGYGRRASSSIVVQPIASNVVHISGGLL
jgi:hypothetical protein